MKLTISRFGYTSKPEPITIKWMQSAELQAKTAKMDILVFFLKYIIFRKEYKLVQNLSFEKARSSLTKLYMYGIIK